MPAPNLLLAILLAAAAPAADAVPTENANPTPQQLYAAAKTPAAAMIKANQLKQEFREQSDGTFIGAVEPTFEQQLNRPSWAKERYQSIVGPWTSVEKRLGSVRNSNGKIVSLQKAFGITEGSTTPYLVVTEIDSQLQPGVHACVGVITGVVEAVPVGAKEPELTARSYGAIKGCGLIKEVLATVDLEKEANASSIEEFERLHFQMADKIDEVLGRKSYRVRVTLPASPEPTATQPE
jgi:hypothetical protein